MKLYFTVIVSRVSHTTPVSSLKMTTKTVETFFDTFKSFNLEARHTSCNTYHYQILCPNKYFHCQHNSIHFIYGLAVYREILGLPSIDKSYRL